MLRAKHIGLRLIPNDKCRRKSAPTEAEAQEEDGFRIGHNEAVREDDQVQSSD